MTNLDEMLGKMTDFLKSEANTETIIGQQFTLGEFTCVPVISVGLGFGGGGGQGKGTSKQVGEGEGIGAGGAAGMGISPVGFLVTRNGDIQFVSTTSSKGLNVLFEKMPDLLEKYFDKNKKEEPSAKN